MNSANIKKPVNEVSEVPKNLPQTSDSYNVDYNISFNLSKKTFKTILKVLIIVAVIFIAAPRVMTNISNTTSVVVGEAEKFPTVFPSLTTVGSSIGSFVFEETKRVSGFISENFAAMVELLYRKKLDNTDPTTIITSEQYVKPTRIIIDSIDVDSIIMNPESSDIKDLDEALKYGVVRYPKSGLLGETDNVYLFGHSTSIKVVRNQTYKALNNLGKLKTGDVIKVQSENKEFTYVVTSVRMEEDSNAVVRFNTGKRTLTISTCDTLGKKEDRYIVEADFVSSAPILATSTTIETTPVTPPITTPVPNPTPITTPVPNPTTLTPGQETTQIIPITEGTTITPSNPLGTIDLDVKISEIGILDADTNEFIATSTLHSTDIIAFKFIISNLGTKNTPNGWTFNIVLPTSPIYIYQSPGQLPIGPGERIEYALGFDKVGTGDTKEIIVNADPTGSIGEISETNNIVKQYIKVID